MSNIWRYQHVIILQEETRITGHLRKSNMGYGACGRNPG